MRLSQFRDDNLFPIYSNIEGGSEGWFQYFKDILMSLLNILISFNLIFKFLFGRKFLKLTEHRPPVSTIHITCRLLENSTWNRFYSNRFVTQKAYYYHFLRYCDHKKLWRHDNERIVLVVYFWHGNHIDRISRYQMFNGICDGIVKLMSKARCRRIYYNERNWMFHDHFPDTLRIFQVTSIKFEEFWQLIILGGWRYTL